MAMSAQSNQLKEPALPKGWKAMRLEDAAHIWSGATPSTQVAAYWNGPIAWCTPSDITGTPGKYLLDTERCITAEGLASCALELLPVGTLLLCSRATIGEIKISLLPVCANQGFKALVCKDGVSNEFLYYLILTLKPQLVGRATGSTFLEIGKRDVAAIEVRMPPYAEQAAIAEALSDVDGLLGALDALIVKKRAIKQAAMQRLLTGKTRLPGFNGVWTEMSLEALAAVTMGQSPPSESYNSAGDGLPLIQGNADLQDRRSIPRVWTTRASRRCVAGDLLLTVRAPVGEVGIASTEACLGRGVCGLKPVGNASFLFQALVFAEPRWKTLEQGSTFTSANARHVGQFTLNTPRDQEEQSAIAAALSDMDAEIATLEARLDKTRAIKQGMMQQLLTGRGRLMNPTPLQVGA